MSASPLSDPRQRGVALLERRQVLAPSPVSAREARRLLRQALEESSRDGWIDAAELAISEVVTNASLHAHTAIEVRLGVFDEEVCVEVRDRNPVLPLQRSYDDEATTGRGMGLVAAVARSCGVLSLGADGKIIWFCVGAVGDGPGEPAASWEVEGWDEPGRTIEETRDVLLAAMPLTLWRSARQHHDAVLRELVLHQADRGDLDLDIESDLAAADRARGIVSAAVFGLLAPRSGNGRADRWLPSAHDVTLAVPLEDRPHFVALQRVLDHAERLARAGELFVRPALPEIVAVRDWVCEQVRIQFDGAPPTPWPGLDQERFEVTVNDRPTSEPSDWDAGAVTEAEVGVIAADEANRIIAVSRPLAAALGWAPDDLVGRRVVTIVPPSLREAHVAGFSRHLSTGEAHILGRPLVFPVLRRDGSEVTCHFRVELAPSRTGPAVYVAWISPLDGDA